MSFLDHLGHALGFASLILFAIVVWVEVFEPGDDEYRFVRSFSSFTRAAALSIIFILALFADLYHGLP